MTLGEIVDAHIARLKTEGEIAQDVELADADLVNLTESEITVTLTNGEDLTISWKRPGQTLTIVR